MRIAVSGTHRAGKSTLVDALAARWPRYQTVDEPYQLLVEDGHDFCHPPSLEDFELQLERSLEELSAAAADVLFDRCPVDLLAYVSVQPDADDFDWDAWIERTRAAVRTLDLIVFVPVEVPDRIRFSSSDDDEGTRALVDEKLRELLLEDTLDLGVEVIEVEGDVAARVKAVLRQIG